MVQYLAALPTAKGALLQPGTVLIDTENTNIENIQTQMLHLVEQGYVVYTKQVYNLVQ